MREIKFRGLRVLDHLKKKNDGVWVYGYLYESVDGSMCIDQWKIDPETVGQYTGLEGKNGVEIYGGDIVTNGTNNFKVIWAKRFGGWGIVDPRTVKKVVHLLATSVSYQEVIGNIHDNPELMKGNE